MRPEYDFDYRQARPNRFARIKGRARTVVLLDPDLSRLFPTPESVHTALRALLKAIPKSSRTHAVNR